MQAAVFAFIALVALTGTDATTYTSGGTCVAHAEAGVVKRAKDAAAVACAQAFASGCSAYSVDKLVVDIEKHTQVMAKALVEVHASAAASCSTYGKYSFGCAAASAHADGFTQATISLISKAYAQACNNCWKCDPVKVKAWSFNIAKLVVKLTAQASVTAKAAVCVGPNETASAAAWKTCTASIWAHGCAYAFAEAMISGGCTNLKADAITTVRNQIKADPHCCCKGYVCLDTQGDSCLKWGRKDGSASKDWGLGWFKTYSPLVYAKYYSECQAASKQLV